MKRIFKLVLLPLLSACAAVLLFAAVTAAAAGPSVQAGPSTPVPASPTVVPGSPSTAAVGAPSTAAALPIQAAAPDPPNNPPDTSVNNSCQGATGQCDPGTASQSNATGSGNTNAGNVNVNNSCMGSTGRCEAGNAHQTNDAGSSGASGGGATVNPTGNSTMGNVNVNNSCMGSTGDCYGGDANQTNRAGNVGNQSLANGVDPPSQTQTASPTGNGADNNFNTNNSCMNSGGTCWSGDANQINDAGNVGSQQQWGGSGSTSQTASPTMNAASNSTNTNNSCMNSSTYCHAGNANQTNSAGNVGSQSIGGQGNGSGDPTQTASPTGNFANDQVNTNNGCAGSAVRCWSGDATENSYAGNVGSQSINGDPSGSTSQTANPSGNGIAQNSNTNNACMGGHDMTTWNGESCQGVGATQYNSTSNVGSQSISGGGDPAQTANPANNSIADDHNTNNACSGTSRVRAAAGAPIRTTCRANIGSQSISGDPAGSTSPTANPTVESANHNTNTNNACQGAGTSSMSTGQACDGGSANQRNVTGNVGSQQIGGGYAADPTQTANPTGNGSDYNTNTNNACQTSNGYCWGGSANQQDVTGNVGSQQISGVGYSASQTANPSYNASNQNMNTNGACQSSNGYCWGGSASDSNVTGNVGQQQISGEGSGSNTQSASPMGNTANHADNLNSGCASSSGDCSARGGATTQVYSGNVGEQTIGGDPSSNSQTANPTGNGPGQTMNINNACWESSGQCSANGGAYQDVNSGNVGEQEISDGHGNTQTASPSNNGPGFAGNTNDACNGASANCEANGSAVQTIPSGNVGEQEVNDGNGNTQTASPSSNGQGTATNVNNGCQSTTGPCEANGGAIQTIPSGNVGEQEVNDGNRNTQTANPAQNGSGSATNTSNACNNNSGYCESNGSAREWIASGNVGEQEISDRNGKVQTASPSNYGPGTASNTNSACDQNTGWCHASGGQRQAVESGNTGEQEIGTADEDMRKPMHE